MLKNLLFGSAFLAVSLSLTGCGGSSSNNKAQYSLKIKNITAAQPMSPLAVVVHNSNYNLFRVGSSASVELEKLAESGDNSLVINTVNTNIEQTKSSLTLLTPSNIQNINIISNAKYISLATMLVNTNDAFAGLNSYDISTIGVGKSVDINLIAYDAGTENNSETTQSIPGLGGEGYNSTKDDTNNLIHVHSGVITADDGLSTSGLTSIHKFENPVATVTISRIK